MWEGELGSKGIPFMWLYKAAVQSDFALLCVVIVCAYVCACVCAFVIPLLPNSPSHLPGCGAPCLICMSVCMCENSLRNSGCHSCLLSTQLTGDGVQ